MTSSVPAGQRKLTGRHVQFIAIGGAVGAGLFLGSGAGIAVAGPAVLLSYAVAGVFVFLIARALGEMALGHPAPGSFVAYAEDYLGRGVGFVTGWSYWLVWVLVGVAELTAVGIFVRFWLPGLPQWVPALLAWGVLYLANRAPVRLFGELEFWMSLIKVVTIVMLIVSGLALVVFGEAGSVQTLVAAGGFVPNGWLAVVNALPIALFAFGGIEMIGLAAAEAEDVARTLPRAINGVVWRILIFYVGSLFVVMLLMPWTLATSGQSPYVLAFEAIGLPAAAAIINAVVLTAVLSSCNSGMFATGRVLSSLAARGHAPRLFEKIDVRGRPLRAVSASAAAMLAGVGLNYLVPEQALSLVISIVAMLLLWTWAVITASHLAHRRRIGRGRFAMPFYPASNYAVLAFIAFVAVSLAVDPASHGMTIVSLAWFTILTLVWMVKRRDAPAKAVLAILLITVLGFASRADAADVRPDSFLGRWFGLREQVEGNFHGRESVDIEIRRAADGGLELVDHNPSLVGYPPSPLTFERDGKLTGTRKSMFGTSVFVADAASPNTLRISMGGEGFDAQRSSTVAVTRNDPRAASYRYPRATANGERQTAYHYEQPSAAQDWDVASLESANIDRARIEEMATAILQQEAEPLHNRTDAVVIIRNGKLVFEEYFWGHAREVPHAISSDTKSLSAMIAGFAYDQAGMRPGDPVSKYFPAYGDTRWIRENYPVTLNDLFSMQAGIEWNEDLPYQDPRNTAVGMIRADDPVRYILNQPLDAQPGTKWKYNSGLPSLVSDVVTNATGEKFDRIADRLLFEPLEIRNYRWSRQKNGEVLASGGVALRPIDSAKLGQLMLDRGMWRGRRILSEDWVALSTALKTKPDDYAYGYYWHLADAAHPRLGKYAGFMAIGQGGQYIVVVPALSLVVVLSSSNWQPGGTRFGLEEIINRFIIPAVRP